jgi:hypothetical protein
VVVRIPCERDLPALAETVSRARLRARVRANIRALKRDGTPLHEAGPPGRITPTALNAEARPRIGAELPYKGSLHAWVGANLV